MRSRPFSFGRGSGPVALPTGAMLLRNHLDRTITHRNEQGEWCGGRTPSGRVAGNGMDLRDGAVIDRAHWTGDHTILDEGLPCGTFVERPL